MCYSVGWRETRLNCLPTSAGTQKLPRTGGGSCGRVDRPDSDQDPGQEGLSSPTRKWEEPAARSPAKQSSPVGEPRLCLTRQGLLASAGSEGT